MATSPSTSTMISGEKERSRDWSSLSGILGSLAASFAVGAAITCLLVTVLRNDLYQAADTPRMSVTTSSLLPFGPPQSSRICNRIKMPLRWTNESQGPYNPAAVRIPSSGRWYTILTLDEVWFGNSEFTRSGTYLEGRMRSHPLLVDMGSGALPSTNGSHTEAQMLDLDESYQQLALAEGGQVYKAADWRPFVWKGDIYVGHWVAYMPGEERMAISRVDLQRGAVELLHRFSTLDPTVEASILPEQATSPARAISRLLDFLTARQPCQVNGFRREKNWGFWEEDGKLMILYGILPCTVVLEFDPLRPSEPSIRSRTCYVLDTIPILQASGLYIGRGQVHISGNPVPWDIQHGAQYQQLFGMLHTKRGEYINWAVRMDRDTHAITHISAGPILSNQDYRNEGFLKTALVVSSFHVLPKEGSNNAEASFVRIFYGEGDRYGCWLDIDTDTIVWHDLRPSRSTKPHRKALRLAPLRSLLSAPVGAL